MIIIELPLLLEELMKGYIICMGYEELYSTWVEINLNAIAGNVRYMVEHTNVAVMAIVKANAYGHGAVPVTNAALSGGASWFGVARVEEAMELRQAGINTSILILGYTPPNRYDDLIENNISLTVWDKEQIKSIAASASQLGCQAKLHLKVDTGMSRLGVQPEYALTMANLIAQSRSLIFEGLFTHFARADEPELPTTRQQEELLMKVLEGLKNEGYQPKYVHAANSAAALTRSSTWFDLLRLGIAMYGLHPSSAVQLSKAFLPALSWKTVLTQIKSFGVKRGVSYGHEFIAQPGNQIGTIPLGYADGFRRIAGNHVLIRGQIVPVIGRVCMDQSMVLLDSVPEAEVGDEVIVIGKQGENHILAEDVAKRWGTINYEVASGIGQRVPRLYI
jgi:alanine racemase